METMYVSDTTGPVIHLFSLQIDGIVENIIKEIIP